MTRSVARATEDAEDRSVPSRSALVTSSVLTLALSTGCAGPAVGDAWRPDAVSPLDAPAIEVLDAQGLDAVSGADGASADATGVTDASATSTSLDAERDRLLATYLARLQASPDTSQSNGLRGRDLADVCALWDAMPPSSQAVFLTVTARLGGARLGSDGSLALAHVTRLHRVAGGGGESASDVGTCGGGENNRLVVSIDPTLHAALRAANDRAGATLPGGERDLADVIGSSFWRDSHDLAGPHAPFTESDETEGGAPRGQVHYFRDPSGGAALAPLGRTDVEALVDPFAMEIDQDYDCVHASNPLCEYVLYGPACAPRTRQTGVEIYGDTYGVVDLGFRPSGC